MLNTLLVCFTVSASVTAIVLADKCKGKCGYGSICAYDPESQTHTCKPIPVLRACESGESSSSSTRGCEEGYKCESAAQKTEDGTGGGSGGTCRALVGTACVINEFCETGAICEKGVCKFKENSECETDDQCVQQAACNDGVCKVTAGEAEGDSDP